jgi:hypothetical protein
MGKVGAIQDLLRGIDKIISTDAPAPTSAPKGADVGQLLTLGNESLEKGKWSVASSRFDLALTVDPTCAEAYLGKLMVDMKCKKREQLSRKNISKKNSQYKLAITYADESLKQELESYAKNTAKRLRKRIIPMISILVSIFLIVAPGITALEINYHVTVKQFYAGKISAKTAYERLDTWSWYREPDKCTQFLIETKVPGAYPAAKDLTYVSIPKGVTSIGDYAFRGCSSLTTITIPNSVTTIGDVAFYYCSSLKIIYFNGTKAEWNQISFGSNWNFGTGNYTVYCTDGAIQK